jgi:hypothetical protein
MDVFIHFPPGVDANKDEIEDVLDDAIGELGEVAGGGIDQSGMSIDLDVEDEVDPDELVGLIREALKSLGVAASKIVVGGKTY